MTEKEMIGEMTFDLIKAISPLGVKDLTEVFNHKKVATELYNLWKWRKIPEGSVVLTEMQYNALLNNQSTVISIDEQLKKEFEYELKQARKETATEILQEIMFVETEEEKWLENEPFVRYVKKMLDKIEEIAKQYGVEVE